MCRDDATGDEACAGTSPTACSAKGIHAKNACAQVDIRKKALAIEDSEANAMELITGPLYELPGAIFANFLSSFWALFE